MILWDTEARERGRERDQLEMEAKMALVCHCDHPTRMLCPSQPVPIGH